MTSCFLPLISLHLWKSSSTTQGPAGCAGAVTQVSLGRCALAGCSLIQAFCPLYAQGMGPFLFCGWCSLSFLLSVHSEDC